MLYLATPWFWQKLFCTFRELWTSIFALNNISKRKHGVPNGLFLMTTFKGKGGDKNKSNKLMSLHIDDNKLLEKYRTTWTKTEDLRNIELNALPNYDDRYKKKSK